LRKLRENAFQATAKRGERAFSASSRLDFSVPAPLIARRLLLKTADAHSKRTINPPGESENSERRCDSCFGVIPCSDKVLSLRIGARFFIIQMTTNAESAAAHQARSGSSDRAHRRVRVYITLSSEELARVRDITSDRRAELCRVLGPGVGDALMHATSVTVAVSYGEGEPPPCLAADCAPDDVQYAALRLRDGVIIEPIEESMPL
jgi:hypothetical protein